jgi:hypothetical protein
MINFPRAIIIGGLIAALPARAVYAPIPEQEQGKDFTFSLRGGIGHDSNIFGSSVNEQESVIWTFAPRAIYNASVTDQTFLSASYGLTLDRFESRPGDKTLDSHEVALRLAHAFTKVTTIDINNVLTVARNPESLLPGVATAPGTTLNTNQSYTRNQLDGRFVTPVTPKIGATVKARSVYYNYHDGQLGRDLDRIENLFGLSGDYAILPEIKGVGEYRHQDVYYRKLGEDKNKSSDYLMGGVDYDVSRKVSVSSRLGVEWRRRRAERDTTSPYAELSAKYDYTEKSFVTGGYLYTLEETSDPKQFNDTKVHRLFVNGQHSVTPLIVASGSFTFEPSTLQGRRFVAAPTGGVQPGHNVSETTIRAGGALTYLPTKNWNTALSYDYDHVWSEEASRDLRRSRVALSGTYTF